MQVTIPIALLFVIKLLEAKLTDFVMF